jgi:hypothetical protein
MPDEDTTVIAVYTGSTSILNYTFDTDIQNLIIMSVGAIFAFIGVMLLVRLPSAWMPATLLIIIAFIAAITSQPNIFGVAIFSLEILMIGIFAFTGTGPQKRQK